MLLAWARAAKAQFTSRLAGGMFLLVLTAFGAHAVFAPARLPPFGALGLEQLGLANPFQALPLPISAETAEAARESARDAVQSGLPYLEAYLAANPQSLPWINRTLAGLAALLLAASMALRMRGPRPS